MAKHSKSIEIDAPASEVYSRWSNWDNLAQYLPQIKSVRRTGPDTTHWIVSVSGMDVEWDARTTADEPGKRIAWESTSGFKNSGEVTFDALGNDRCKCTVTVDYEPPLGASEGLFGIGKKVDEKLQEGLENVRDDVEGEPVGAGSRY